MALPSIRSISTAVGTSNTTSATQTAIVTAPSGMASGDFLIAQVVANSTAASAAITAPAGWTTLNDFNDGAGIEVTYFSKTADSTDVSTGTFTFGYSTGGSLQSHMIATVVAVTGHYATTPINIARYANGTGVSVTGSTVTPSTQCLFLFFVGSANTSGFDSGTHSGYAIASNNPSWTESYDTASAGSTGNHSTSIALAYASQSAAGGVATGAITESVSVSAVKWGMAFLAIQPAPTVVVSTPLSVTTTLPAPSFRRTIVATALNVLSTLGIPTITTAGTWKFPSKNSSSWNFPSKNTSNN